MEITLRNIAEFSTVQIIEYAIKRMEEQREKCLGCIHMEFSSINRAPRYQYYGWYCAVGVFIPQNEYSEQMEGKSVLNLIDRYGYDDCYINLLSLLQWAHDRSLDYGDMMDRLKYIRRIVEEKGDKYKDVGDNIISDARDKFYY